MKLECLQENLAEGLAVVGRVVPTKSTLPVLSNVLVAAREAELQLAATNLELAVAHRVPASVNHPGEITLPARLLADYVALLDLAGVDPSATEVQAEPHHLLVRGVRRERHTTSERSYHALEIP